jgi:hypothetical protein
MKRKPALPGADRKPRDDVTSSASRTQDLGTQNQDHFLLIG